MRQGSMHASRLLRRAEAEFPGQQQDASTFSPPVAVACHTWSEACSLGAWQGPADMIFGMARYSVTTIFLGAGWPPISCAQFDAASRGAPKCGCGRGLALCIALNCLHGPQAWPAHANHTCPAEPRSGVNLIGEPIRGLATPHHALCLLNPAPHLEATHLRLSGGEHGPGRVYLIWGNHGHSMGHPLMAALETGLAIWLIITIRTEKTL